MEYQSPDSCKSKTMVWIAIKSVAARPIRKPKILLMAFSFTKVCTPNGVRYPLIGETG
jgi:hypothetical protein